MIPWQQIGSASVPDGGRPILLMQRGDEFAIRLGPLALMSSLDHGSEEVLAELRAGARWPRQGAPPDRRARHGVHACRGAADARPGRAGRGGRTHPRRRRLEPWPARAPRRQASRGSTGHGLGGRCRRADRRGAGRLRCDLARCGQRTGRSYPRRQRQPVYGRWPAGGFAALRPGGLLGVWSVAPDPEFTRRLQKLDSPWNRRPSVPAAPRVDDTRSGLRRGRESSSACAEDRRRPRANPPAAAGGAPGGGADEGRD